MRLVLRTSMAWLAVGLAASALRIAELPLAFSTLAPVFLVSCATRLQNDWRDRDHDRRKGKLLASSHGKMFLAAVLGCWAVCCVVIANAALQNRMLALLFAAMACAGLLYSETRRVPGLPISISAICSASVAFLPWTLRPQAGPMLPLFGGAALFIFGREILKDLEDQKIDEGYKWTIPVAFGQRTAKWLGMSSIAAACAFFGVVSPWALGGIVVVGGGLISFGSDRPPSATMRWLDAGAALVLAAILAFPSGLPSL